MIIEGYNLYEMSTIRIPYDFRESKFTPIVKKYYFINIFGKNTLGEWGWAVRDKNKSEGPPEEFIEYPDEDVSVEDFDAMLMLRQL